MVRRSVGPSANAPQLSVHKQQYYNDIDHYHDAIGDPAGHNGVIRKLGGSTEREKRPDDPEDRYHPADAEEDPVGGHAAAVFRGGGLRGDLQSGGHVVSKDLHSGSSVKSRSAFVPGGVVLSSCLQKGLASSRLVRLRSYVNREVGRRSEESCGAKEVLALRICSFVSRNWRVNLERFS